MLVENLLRSKKYWEWVERGVTDVPPNVTLEQRKLAEENKLKDLKAKNYLCQAIDQTILETILICDTTNDI